MLFHPFRDEAELFPDDEEKCIELYLKNEDKIKRAQARLMPFLESVDEAQKLYQENRAKEQRDIEEVMGAELDPAMEQEAADADFQNIYYNHFFEKTKYEFPSCRSSSVPCLDQVSVQKIKWVKNWGLKVEVNTTVSHLKLK